MRIRAIETFLANLPFHFTVRHSLAQRQGSTSIIVRVLLDDGSEGFGEGVPREYVTGEDVCKAVFCIKTVFAPRLIGRLLPEGAGIINFLEAEHDLIGLEQKQWGASWCALEMAVLDAVAKAQDLHLSRLLGGAHRFRIKYGAVIPFARPAAVIAMLAFCRLYGFDTIKIKVGRSLKDDLTAVRLARQIMGPDVTLRVDANCAWTAGQAIAAACELGKFAVASIEQPVPAGDIEGLKQVSASIKQKVIADESVCTIKQASTLARMKACHGFNIRLSKVGGLLAARRIASIARQAGMSCQVGAQVGESGILSAAGRLFACVEPACDHYEGAYNGFLLKKDLTQENLTAGPGGWGQLLQGTGIGITVRRELLKRAGLESLLQLHPQEVVSHAE